MTFTQQKERARKIKNNLAIGETLSDGKDFDFLMELFKQHPDYDFKFSNGCTGFIKQKRVEWGNMNECLCIIDNDLNTHVISVNFTKTVNKYNEVMKALRTSIYPQIKEFKKSFVAGETKCEISGVILYDLYNVHIDHHNMDFIELVSIFMQDKTFSDLQTKVIYDETICKFNDQNLIDSFATFHKENTTLRFVDKKENMSKIKQYFKGSKL
jgi:hypothetical protein